MRSKIFQGVDDVKAAASAEHDVEQRHRYSVMLQLDDCVDRRIGADNAEAESLQLVRNEVAERRIVFDEQDALSVDLAAHGRGYVHVRFRDILSTTDRMGTREKRGAAKRAA